MVFALVIALAVPAMAASNLDVSGEVEFENAKVTDGGDNSSTADLELYLEKAVEENITLYSEIDVGYAFADETDNVHTTEIKEAWVNVDDAFAAIDLKLGRMFEESADSMLYEFDTEEFVRLAYEADNLAVKLGHNLDNDPANADAANADAATNNKLLFLEGELTDLGLVDALTLNYVDDNGEDYDGYSLKFAKKHDFGDAAFIYGDAAEGNLMDLKVTSDTLVNNATLSFEYADFENEYLVSSADNGILTDATVTGDTSVIKPGIEMELADKLTGYGYYALYSGENDSEENYLDAGVVYDLAESTDLEVEFENYSEKDETTITTTVTTNF
jgi:hypothetical protein